MNKFSFFKQKQKDHILNIDHKNEFIFIHIPKNAGTSISKSIGLEQTSHITIREIKSILSKEVFSSYFKFCFVRNPWDRFLSLYNYARLEESYYHSSVNPLKAKFGKHLDYDLLKDASFKECAYFLLDNKLKHDRTWNHWNEQISWITDEKGNKIIDFIGRVENINRDLKQVSEIINKKIKNIYELNYSISNHSSYKSSYDQETANIIRTFYNNDIEAFDYSF